MAAAVDRTVIRQAAQNLRTGQRLLVLAGAGLSADAGVPTFRDAAGYWRHHDPERLASAAGFAADPELVWEWYRERREQVAGCQPHQGQRSLALLQRHLPYPGRVLMATTNEDDLLERAGCQNVVHLHGELFITRCAGDGCVWQRSDGADSGLSFLPCPRCGGRVRPGSIWFGEPVPPLALGRIERFRADACLVVGSSALVQPVAAIPPELALAGAPVVEINPIETPLSRLATVWLRGGAVELLPHLVDELTSATIRHQSREIDMGDAPTDSGL
ncbi:MAG: SIR2 family NAD-dependent protein deacylase [Planctomycetota bacterium]